MKPPVGASIAPQQNSSFTLRILNLCSLLIGFQNVLPNYSCIKELYRSSTNFIEALSLKLFFKKTQNTFENIIMLNMEIRFKNKASSCPITCIMLGMQLTLLCFKIKSSDVERMM